MTCNRATISFGILGSALALLWLAMFQLGTGDVDLAVLARFYASDRPILADGARLLTLLGGWYFVTPVAAIGGLIVGMRGRPWLGLVLFIGPFIGRMLVELQKYGLGRIRPDEHPHLVNVYNLSFPSGHSANAMMVYVTMALTVVDGERRMPWLAAAFVLALLIGLSRLVLGVHWPSDVIAGWSFGLLWAMLLVWIAGRPPAWAVKR
jgi:undecaprenyl-diphosphatase